MTESTAGPVTTTEEVKTTTVTTAGGEELKTVTTSVPLVSTTPGEPWFWSLRAFGSGRARGGSEAVEFEERERGRRFGWSDLKLSNLFVCVFAIFVRVLPGADGPRRRTCDGASY